MAKPNLPPIEICYEFLRALQATVAARGAPLVPVLRGCLLLQHWFGQAARPALNIELECFERPRWGYGYYGRSTWVGHLGKAMCQFAAESTRYCEWTPAEPHPDVEFQEVENPENGPNLETSGSPGERYETAWVWHARAGATGRLQIDIAQPMVYDLDDIAVTEVKPHSDGPFFHFQAYTQEMMLAARLASILRGLKRQENGPPQWHGELKNLFDAHILVTQGKLDAERFEKSMLAVAAEEKLNWRSLDALADRGLGAMTDDDFSTWPEFQDAYSEQTTCGPVDMLRTVAESLDPLLAGLRAHVPFLLAIQADPAHEASYLIYADWLQERGDSRGDFLRRAIQWMFHEDKRSDEEQLLPKMATPWQYHLFGNAERLREFKQKVEA